MRSGNIEDARILIVDNNAFGRDTLRHTLLGIGADKVSVATSANNAIAMCKLNDYEVLMSEYELGEGKNGQQLLEELRARKHLKNTSAFLLLTSDTSREVVLSSLEFTPDDYLAKPYLEPTLVKRLKRTLRYKHQLKQVFMAIDEGSRFAAIECCSEYLRDHSDFKTSALRLLAELYLATEQIDRAFDIFDSVLLGSGADWARMGLAKVYLQQGRVEEAEVLFEELIEINFMYVEAYEQLAQIYQQRGDNIKAEQLLGRAIEVSPLSMHRQQLFVDICERNNNFERAAKAWRQILRISRHSQHETGENHLRLSSCLTEYCDYENLYSDDKVSNEIGRNLMTMRKKYTPSEDSEMQAQLIEGRLLIGKGLAEKGRQVVGDISDRFDNKPALFSEMSKLELAKSLSDAGESSKAQRVLKLLVRDCDDEKLLSRADKVLDEPVSDDGKRRIIVLNRRGIELFKQKDFKRSIQAFSKAQASFPRNIELTLNLVQALVKQIAAESAERQQKKYYQQADQCLQLISGIKQQHKKYNNYRRLKAELDEMQSQFA